jgi:hypothetical protein
LAGATDNGDAYFAVTLLRSKSEGPVLIRVAELAQHDWPNFATSCPL